MVIKLGPRGIFESNVKVDYFVVSRHSCSSSSKFKRTSNVSGIFSATNLSFRLEVSAVKYSRVFCRLPFVFTKVVCVRILF